MLFRPQARKTNLIIGVIPEGPIAFDGEFYRYSKGERLYLDTLSKDFEELHLLTLVLQKGDSSYETCLHSRFKSDNLYVYEMPRPQHQNLSIFGKIVHFFKIFLFLILHVRKVDILYVFLPGYPAALGWLACKLFGIPHIVYGADDWDTASESMFKWPKYKNTIFYNFYKRLNLFFEKKIVRTALFSVVAGGQLKAKYEMIGCETFHTSPRMTLTKKDIFEREDTCEGHEINLVHVGALIHDKSQHTLIESFNKSYLKNNSLRLKIIGEGPLRNQLENQVNSLNLDTVVDFIGYVEREEELYSYLKSSDIFVLTSVTEGFPRVLYEAMAHNLPVISTKVGGIPYLLKDRYDAMLCDVNDVSGISKAIDTIVFEKNLRVQIISNARDTMEQIFARSDPHQIHKLVHRKISNNKH